MKKLALKDSVKKPQGSQPLKRKVGYIVENDPPVSSFSLLSLKRKLIST